MLNVLVLPLIHLETQRHFTRTASLLHYLLLTIRSKWSQICPFILHKFLKSFTMMQWKDHSSSPQCFWHQGLACRRQLSHRQVGRGMVSGWFKPITHIEFAEQGESSGGNASDGGSSKYRCCFPQSPTTHLLLLSPVPNPSGVEDPWTIGFKEKWFKSQLYYLL